MLQRYNENRRYLEFRGKPILSVGSAEHYGAALNADFDYKAYMDECVRCGLNQGRVFSGSYREVPGSFGIEDNTMAPEPGAFLCPWKKVGDQWDLAQWDEAYWTRLREIAAYASEREYLLEYVLFCYFYGDSMWVASPMNEIFAWNSGAVSAAALGSPGKRYIIYDDGDAGLEKHGLGLPAGEYAIRWLDPVGCKEIHAETKTFDGNGLLRLSAPNATGEVVVILTRV